MAPDVHISIVSYNTRELLDACLKSLVAHDSRASFAVTVVDNGSADGSVAMVRETHPEVEIVETKANLGYGRANNAALLNSPGRYYLILNSDTLIHDGAIDALVDYMDLHFEVGAAGGALLNPDGTPQTNWAVGELTVASVAYEQTYLAKRFPKSRKFGDYFRAWWPRNADTLIPQACGACLIVRADLYNELGGFDPRIFMYAEDTDLCKRIRDKGLAVAYVAGAKITHVHGQSSVGSLRPKMIFEHNRSRIYYFLKHDGPAVAGAARGWMVAGALLRAVLWFGAALAGRKGALASGSAFVTVAALTATARVTLPRGARS